VYIPLVLRQYAFATPPPATPTPTPSVTPLPTCETVDHEPNNFFLDADNNLPLCENVPLSGGLSSNDLNDIYRVELSETGTIRFDLTDMPANSNFDLYLYDSLKAAVTSSIHDGSVDENITFPLDAGRYYIRVVFGELSAPGTYQLQWIGE
jgi:hypothetical protein